MKLILIGDSAVGKSNILSKYLKNYFDSDSIATIGVEFGTKNIEIEGKKIKSKYKYGIQHGKKGINQLQVLIIKVLNVHL